MTNFFQAIKNTFKKDEDELVPQPPKPTAIQKFFQPVPTATRTRDVLREIPGATARTAKGIKDFTVGALQSFPRNILSTSMTIAESQRQRAKALGVDPGKIGLEPPAPFKPETKVQQAILGKEPVADIPTRIKTGSPKAQDILKTIGVEEQKAAKISPYLAAGVTLGDIGLDIIPGGKGAKPVVKKVGKEIIEKAGKEGVEKIVKQTVKNADELAVALKSMVGVGKHELDDVLVGLTKKFDVAESVLKDLKSGKVFDDIGYTFFAGQTKDDAGKLVVNALDEPAVKKVIKEVPDVKPAKDIDEVTRGVDEAVEKADEIGADVVSDIPIKPGDKPPTKAPGKKPTLNVEEELAKPTYSNLEEGQKEAIKTVLENPELVQRIEKIRGKTLTHEEVAEEAVRSQNALGKIFGRGESEAIQAEMKNSANRVSALSQQIMNEGSSEALKRELGEEIVKLKSIKSYFGRGLEFSKEVGDAGAPVGSEILSEIFAKSDASIDDVLDAFAKTDINNPQEFRKMYFEFVQPKVGEILDEMRYINILSSPKTQMRNINANFIDSVITEPATKLARSVVDGVKSTITQKPREHFAGEAVEYYRGFLGAWGEAGQAAKEVMQGRRFVEQPDLAAIPIGKYAGAKLSEIGVPEPIAKGIAAGMEKGGVVSKALEAGDILFTTLIKKGEEAAQLYRRSKGVDLTDEAIKETAERVAKDVTLRSPLDPKNLSGQGAVASGIDVITSTIANLRKSPHKLVNIPAKVTFPFLRTTSNYLKRFIEYTPGLGIVNAIGRENVDELVARQITGSTLLAASIFYAFKAGAEDRLTWEAPSGEEEKTLFYDSGRKPYSIKIGDRWVGYQQLGMAGAPLALTASLKHQMDNDKDVSESQIESVARAYASLIPMFGDMSFARGFGNISDAFKGERDALSKMGNEVIRQGIPLAGFQGWAKSMIDPIYRTSDPREEFEGKPVGLVLKALAPSIKNLPGFSTLYEPYRDTRGEPSRISQPFINALTPLTISKEDPVFDFLYQGKRLESQATKLSRDFKDGEIDVGEVETGVNKILNNYIDFLGGDSAKVKNFELPEGIDPGLTIPQKKKESLNITDKQLAEVAQTLPQVKAQLLSALTGGEQGVSPLATTTVQGGVKLASVTAPPASVSRQAKPIQLSSIDSTTRPTAGVDLPSSLALAKTLPPTKTSLPTAEELARDRTGRGVRLS